MALSVRFRTALVLATSLARPRLRVLSAGMTATGITIIMAVVTLPVRRSSEVSSVSGWALRSHPAVITRRRRCITERPGTIMHRRRPSNTATATDDGQSRHRAQCPPPSSKTNLGVL